MSAQVVFYNQRLFYGFECVWPGSVDDVKVFANSLINKKLRNGNLSITFQTLMKNQVKVPAYSISGSLSSFFLS